MTPTADRRRLRLGTRRSQLAQRQSGRVAEAIIELEGAPEVELVLIETRGDRLKDVPLTEVAGTAFFTSELEQALLNDEVDVAVHSLKDLPSEPREGLLVAAVPQREDPRDVLVSPEGLGIEQLPPGARVGTGSVRRQALLRRLRPDIEPLELRGNVTTRLAKLDAGHYDAIVLAAAGLRRLGLEDRIGEVLPGDRFPPAPGQGALAVQCRETDLETRRWLEPLDDLGSRLEVTAERALLGEVHGGCQAPVGVLARRRDNRLQVSAVVCALSDRKTVGGSDEIELCGERELDLEEASRLGERLAGRLLEAGAEAILEQLRGGG